jgi:D-xylose transport system permease protein
MTKPTNEPTVDRPPVNADVAPPTVVGAEVSPAVTAEGERQTRIGGLRLPTESLRAYTMIVALVVIWLYFQWATVSDLYPYGIFLHPNNFSKLLQQMAVTGVLAVGMLMVIVAGQIDLSVGSVVGLLGGVAAMTQDLGGAGFAASLASALLAGLAIGALHGGLVAYANIPAFIVTLGGMLAWRGLILRWSGGETIPLSDENLKGIGRNLLAPEVGWALAAVSIAAVAWLTLSRNRARRRHGLSVPSTAATAARIVFPSVLILAFIKLMNAQEGVPIPVVVLLAVALLGAFLTQNTTFGRYLYAIGGNPDAARLSGISLRRYILSAFCVMGVLAGVASILHTARLQSSSPDAGSLMELDAIAACVIGGTSLMGGRGTVFGAVLGALIMASLDNGMSLRNVENSTQYIIKGAVLVAAVWFDMLGRRKG